MAQRAGIKPRRSNEKIQWASLQKSFSFLKQNVYPIFCALQSKLEWARNEVRSRRERELMMRSNIQVAMETSEQDKQYLMDELARHNTVTMDMAERDLEHDDTINTLQVDFAVWLSNILRSVPTTNTATTQ